MSRFDFTNKLNFDEIDLTPPVEVLDAISDELLEATRGKICLGVEPYEGTITQQQPSFATAIAGMLQKASASLTILPEMGKIGEEIHQYELFLYTPSYKGYRFRLMFIRYGVASYPTEIILEQGTADAFSDIASTDNFEPIIQVSSRKEFEMFIDRIFSIPYILGVMQELIRVDQVQTHKEAEKWKKVETYIELCGDV